MKYSMFREHFVARSMILLFLTQSLLIAGQETKTLRLAHGLNTEHPVHKAMIFMSQKVNEKSGGKLKVEIYPSEQLGNEKECIEAIQLGYLSMTKISTGVMESFVSDFKIFGIPYLFRDSEHFWAVCNGDVGKELLTSGEAKGLKGLCYYDAGARSFYAKKPINSPSDLNSNGVTLKVRVMNSPMAREMVSTMGGAPTPISWGELYTSLDQGVVDAAENNPPSFFTSHHYEICRYYSLDEHVRLPDLLVIGTKVWADLTVDEQKILQEAVDESVIYQRKLWAQSEQQALEKASQDGVKIIYPDKQPFVDSVQPIWDKYRKQSLGKLIDRIQEIK